MVVRMKQEVSPTIQTQQTTGLQLWMLQTTQIYQSSRLHHRHKIMGQLQVRTKATKTIMRTESQFKKINQVEATEKHSQNDPELALCYNNQSF